MSHAVKCPACGAKFALPEDLYDRKVKGRVVTVRCKHCQGNITVDGTSSPPQSERPELLDESAIDSRPLDETPTVPLGEGRAPTVPPVKGLWVVSFADDDDRELTRSQIEAALKRGDIDADTIVWREGMAEWKVIADIPALAPLLGEGNETGGFLGTGMKVSAGEKALRAAVEKAKKKRPTLAPPPSDPKGKKPEPPKPEPPKPQPKAARETEDPELGAIRSVSAGTLFMGKEQAGDAPPSLDPVSLKDDEIESVKPRRFKSEPPKKPQSKPPPPKAKPLAPGARKPAQLRADDGEDEEAPESGTPDLRSLTTSVGPPLRKTAKQAKSDTSERADEDIFGLGTGAIVGSPLAPPTIDLSTPVLPEVEDDEDYEIEDDERESEPPKKVAKKKPADSVAATARTSPKARERDEGKTISPVVWLALGGAALFAGWWFFLRTPKPSEPLSPPESTVATAATEAPVRPETPATTQTEEPAAATPEPSDSAETKPDVPAADQHPSEPTEKPASETPAEKPSAASEKPSEPSEKPAEPTEKPAEPDKEVALAAPFDKGAAVAALNSAAGAASACRKEGDPSGTATVVVTFAPSGRVTSANVNGPPFAGTPTGGCIASTMRRAHVPAFTGDYVTVSKTVTIR